MARGRARLRYVIEIPSTPSPLPSSSYPGSAPGGEALCRRSLDGAPGSPADDEHQEPHRFAGVFVVVGREQRAPNAFLFHFRRQPEGRRHK